MKKALRETQILRAGCSKAEPKISATPQTPCPGAQDGQNLISWRWSLLSPTDTVWGRSMHENSSYRDNRPTNKQKHTNTQRNTQINRQDRLQYTAPLSLACSVMKKALGETQTLRAGCSKAEPKKFHLAADPLPGVQDGQNLISWIWSLPSPTDPVW